jgi:hypothetical protein
LNATYPLILTPFAATTSPVKDEYPLIFIPVGAPIVVYPFAHKRTSVKVEEPLTVIPPKAIRARPPVLGVAIILEEPLMSISPVTTSVVGFVIVMS